MQSSAGDTDRAVPFTDFQIHIYMFESSIHFTVFKMRQLKTASPLRTQVANEQSSFNTTLVKATDERKSQYRNRVIDKGAIQKPEEIT